MKTIQVEITILESAGYGAPRSVTRRCRVIGDDQAEAWMDGGLLCVADRPRGQPGRKVRRMPVNLPAPTVWSRGKMLGHCGWAGASGSGPATSVIVEVGE